MASGSRRRASTHAPPPPAQAILLIARPRAPHELHVELLVVPSIHDPLLQDVDLALAVAEKEHSASARCVYARGLATSEPSCVDNSDDLVFVLQARASDGRSVLELATLEQESDAHAKIERICTSVSTVSPGCTATLAIGSPPSDKTSMQMLSAASPLPESSPSDGPGARWSIVAPASSPPGDSRRAPLTAPRRTH
eukprot:CAMPEP_0117575196 /NCGR_PEP_ID=MMETSP0784-20121206/62071_1 /TAXON_ID=39447 /ORGANISM="" /LENGTH=195 /DNA_ID=CAMNT_0005374237 /DNA_START=242 /DNA_END=827 /DNA_ORIENTATION=-